MARFQTVRHFTSFTTYWQSQRHALTAPAGRVRKHFSISWSMTLCLAVAVVGCSAEQPAETPASTPSSPATLTLDEVRQMLQKELTVAQLKQRLGKPVCGSDETWGNLMYELPGKEHVLFWFKGPYVTGASYGQTEIAGISPKTHQVLVGWRLSKSTTVTMVWYLMMDGHEFGSLEQLGTYIQSLPKGSLVEYHVDDVVFDQLRPLSTGQDYDNLRRICHDANVILLFYPGG